MRFLSARASRIASIICVSLMGSSSCGDDSGGRKADADAKDTGNVQDAADTGGAGEVAASDVAETSAPDAAEVQSDASPADFPSIPTAPGKHELTFTHDGVGRVLIVQVPAGYTHRDDDLRPLLVGLHGGGGSAQQIHKQKDFERYADETGYIFVAVQGMPNDDGDGNGWNASAAFDTGAADDVGYLEAVVLGVSAALKVDPDRRYMAGFSGGATMTVRFATEKSELLAAIATFAGKVGRSPDETPAFVFPQPPTTPLSVQMTYGSEDPNLEGELQGGSLSTSARQGMDWWAEQLGCGAAPVSDAQGRFTFDVWSGCRSGVVVRMLTIADMGHTWPEKDAEGVDGTKLLLEFFDGRAKP